MGEKDIQMFDGEYCHDFVEEEAINPTVESSFFLPIEVVHTMAIFTFCNPTHITQ